MAKWQKCPVCDGVGSVSGGYFLRAGNVTSWMSADALEQCRICEGIGIIREPEERKDKENG